MIGSSEGYAFSGASDWATQSLNEPFGSTTRPEWAGTKFLTGMTVNGVNVRYGFEYQWPWTGELSKVTLPTGGYIRWQVDAWNYLGGKSQREAYSWVHSSSAFGAPNEKSYYIGHGNAARRGTEQLRTIATVQEPDSSTIKQWNFNSAGLVTQYEVFSYPGWASKLKVVPVWGADNNLKPYITSTTTTWDASSTLNAKSKKTTQSMDDWGNVTQMGLYDWNDNGALPKRQIDNTMATFAGAAFIKNRLLQQTLKLNGAGGGGGAPGNTLGVTVAPNTASTMRVGKVTVGNQNYTVTQAASGPASPFSISPNAGAGAADTLTLIGMQSPAAQTLETHFLFQDYAAGPTPVLTNACHGWVMATSSTYLHDDAGVLITPQTYLGESWATNRENSQCLIDAPSSTAVTSNGTSWSFGIRLKFKAQWAGKTLRAFMRKRDVNYVYGPWEVVGAFTLSAAGGLTLSPQAAAIGSGGGALSSTVSGGAWTATSNDSWITVTTGSGGGSGGGGGTASDGLPQLVTTVLNGYDQYQSNCGSGLPGGCTMGAVSNPRLHDSTTYTTSYTRREGI